MLPYWRGNRLAGTLTQSEFIECVDHAITVSHGARGVAHTQHRLQSGRLCRVELSLDVRKKHNLLRSQREDSSNFPITIGFGLCSHRGVKIGADKRCEITDCGVCEEQ